MGDRTSELALRPAVPGDRDLLLRVYGSTRADELALVDWPDEQKRAFVGMQFEAQDRHYREHYPSASFDVVEVGGEPVGRLYVDRRPAEIRVVDIALLPEHRNGGLGTTLLLRVMEEAAASGRTVTIHVEVFNPALRLYARLGFRPVEEHGVHRLREWVPGGPDGRERAGGGQEARLDHGGQDGAGDDATRAIDNSALRGMR